MAESPVPALLNAVRDLVLKGTDESTGWRPYLPSGSHRVRDRDLLRRWLRVKDTSIADGLALTSFAWDEPGTPDLDYFVVGPIVGDAEPDNAAQRIVEHLTRLLHPDWRNTVTKLWLGRRTVLIYDTGRHIAARDELEERRWRGAE